MMTKGDFIQLADMIKEHNDFLGHYQVQNFHWDHLKTLVNFCKSMNPQFKEQLWLDYIHGKCGPNGGKLK